MESPHKRLKPSPPEIQSEADFVPLGGAQDEDEGNHFGYHTTTNGFTEAPDQQGISSAPRAPRAMYQQSSGSRDHRSARSDPRNAKDKPKSKHPLPGHEPWLLVKTKFGRRFVHNSETKQSLWRIPPDVMSGVRELERGEREQKEKEVNAKWAEDQLKEMHRSEINKDANASRDGRDRRRRSESLQREDEEAMMAALAAEAEKAEEQDARAVIENVEPLQPNTVQAGGGYDSDSSYEEVEVTDSEFEDEDARPQSSARRNDGEQHDGDPVEFGEDDIAYQFAALEEDYPAEDGDEEQHDSEQGYVDEWDIQQDGSEPRLSDDEAIQLFRNMLHDHHISPFTPWSKLLEDESANGIILDDRYTVLPTTRSRKEAWQTWVKDTAARLQEERAATEKLDPRIPYLAFLAENAMSPKLYWPEFKRKYKKESVMSERKLAERDRERLYRDHVHRLKLPESTRKADLLALLESIPLLDLDKSATTLPPRLLSHLHYISLPLSVRDEVVLTYMSSLPAVSPAEAGEEGGE